MSNRDKRNKRKRFLDKKSRVKPKKKRKKIVTQGKVRYR